MIRAARVIALPICFLIGALVSLASGQDANWDLLNYHLYDGAALLHGRFDQDLLAAGLQSSLNPLLDALYAGLALGPLKTHPRWLAAAMGLWYGGALYLAGRLALLLYGRRWTAAGAVLLAVTGVAATSQIGTTTNELQAGVIMLGGLFALLRRADTPTPFATILCGLLFGIAAGLKLTAIVYAPAACLAVACLHRPRRIPAACALFAAGWALGFLAVDGWWALRLYHRFGSPTFPLLNGLFRSPWYPPANFADTRFIPRGLVQWLFYPLSWPGTPAPLGEPPFRDLRPATVFLLAIAALAAWPWRKAHPLQPIERGALAFLAAGYLSWLATTSILRYAVILEITAGLVAPLLLARLLPRRAVLPALGVVLAVVLLTTSYPTTFRVPYRKQTLEADAGWAEPGMLVVLTFRGPNSHIVALLPHQDSISVLNIGNTLLEARGWPLHDEAVRRIRDHPGRIVVVTQGNANGYFPELNEVGLSPTLTNCRAIATTFVPASGAGLHVCDVRRMPPPVLSSPFWAQAARHYRTLVQPPDQMQPLIGAAYLAAAGPTARGTRFMDWTDLLWSGVGNTADPVPNHPDPGTLYVLAPQFVSQMAARLDPASDMLGLIVAAPGWRRCLACTAPLDPIRLDDAATPLAPGSFRRLGRDAASAYWGAGWWTEGAGAIWSKQQSDLLFPLAADLPERFRLVLTGTVLTGPGLEVQRVTVEVPGHADPAEARTIAGVAEISLVVRREWLERRADGTFLLPVRLGFPDAASPAQIGAGLDPRVLGFAPSFVRLETQPETQLDTK